MKACCAIQFHDSFDIRKACENEIAQLMIGSLGSFCVEKYTFLTKTHNRIATIAPFSFVYTEKLKFLGYVTLNSLHTFLDLHFALEYLRRMSYVKQTLEAVARRISV